ncbi:hypothetical protein CE91St25_15200 [Campylobacter ureolyticus]|uniref:hypothetical protein n=1 Tax=Campylobacter ureolyticus TaxID=827 RepID=UPI001FC875A0|nr:hypothetical protein [Campylobacter ureolyticus]GKH61184.1 hypothetical protein CE91St25_15200 [Campylobacter ureolyticus]
MQYEKIDVYTRTELILRIKALLDANGWQTYQKSEQTLYASDCLGGGITLNFEAWHSDPNYGRSLRAGAYACFSVDETKDYDKQEGNNEIAYFQFNQPNINGAEFSGGYLFADDKTLMIALDIDPNKQVVIIFSYITKSHEFNGGRVCYASASYGNDKYYGKKTEDYKLSNQVPFGLSTNTQKTSVFIGEAWQDIDGVNTRFGDIRTDLRTSKILTNLMPKNLNYSSLNFNFLSSVSAYDFLDSKKAKSSFSGLQTMLTPNFFYKNNENHWVYAGALECVRVFNEYPNLYENGTILHLGSEKFFTFRPHKNPGVNPPSSNYSMAVKIV